MNTRLSTDSPLRPTIGNVTLAVVAALLVFASTIASVTSVYVVVSYAQSPSSDGSGVESFLPFALVAFCFAFAFAFLIGAIAAVILGVPLALALGWLGRRLPSWKAHALLTASAGLLAAVGAVAASGLLENEWHPIVLYAPQLAIVALVAAASAFVGWLFTWQLDVARQGRRAGDIPPAQPSIA